MPTPRIIRAAQTLLHQISRMARSFTKGLISWLLRSLLVLGKQPRWSKAGFVLPTTVLLLLVVTLTVGAIGFRTFTRTQQTIGERQQRVIYNAATPAIDRAKAKLEFLFDINRDPRGGVVPPEDTLVHMMLNDGLAGVSKHPSNIDPYTFTTGQTEERLDLNGDGTKDNAWKYKADTDGDGVVDATIAYSIIFKAPGTLEELKDTRDNVAGAGASKRANNLQIRNSPLSSATQLNSCRSRTTPTGVESVNLTRDAGWFKDPTNNTILRKNFQVNVYVLPDKPNGAVATLEFQQDRQANQGFKWAAWFRNDLEIFPGPQFNWNGAMHTEGSYIISGAFRGYMISGFKSCLYTRDASELTSATVTKDDNNKIPAFQGQFITGTVRDNSFSGSPNFDLWNGAGVAPITDNTTEMGEGKDSVVPGNYLPADFALDPVKLHTKDISVSRNPLIANPASLRDSKWENGAFRQKERMRNEGQAAPYVDDTFRADNRWGPKPRWGEQRLPIGPMGSPIIGQVELTGNDPVPGGDSDSVGLDGYWERRARREGLRLIVGQRLELGDPAGWGGPGPATPNTITTGADDHKIDPINEPLRPWSDCVTTTRCNEARQRRTLWDNLASVQATAVYHAAYDASSTPDSLPLACIATTVHPGTAGTLDKSSTFENLAFGLPSRTIYDATSPLNINYSDPAKPLIISDFFRGRGTNGWEYGVPKLEDFRTSTSPLRNALRNLAQFAGDPSGGTPSFPPPPNDQYAPYPLMSMWGDFSMLRRVIGLMEEGGTPYDALSPADKSTLHTAGCTLGMLAYNLDYLEKIPKVATLPAELIGKTVPGGLALPPSPTSSSPLNADARMGLRGYIRILDAAISKKNSAYADVFATDRNFTDTSTKVPKEIIELSKDDMSKMVGNITGSELFGDPTGSDNPETYVRLMERWRDRLGASNPEYDKLNKAIYLAQLLITREQVARDRTHGFLGGAAATGAISLAPLGECQDWKTNKDELRRLCSARPRYPILYSLFPARQPLTPPAPTTPLNTWYASNLFRNHGDIDSERSEEQFLNVRDKVDRNNSYIRTIANVGVEYKVVKPETVAILPRSAQGMGSTESWKLPSAAAATGTTPNSNSQDLIKVCATSPCSLPQSTDRRAPALSADLVRVPFKDAALYNGRELMSVRTLDLDLDLMRTTATPAGDYWLPKAGIVYAFREDAVSEAQISRKKLGNWEACAGDTALPGALQNNPVCQMRTDAAVLNDNEITNFDPPLSRDPDGITPKPVDFFADPDRRPHGFRLRNGATVKRTGDNGVGLSFITDNPAYVQGAFNLHQAAGATEIPAGTGLEEFLERVDATFSNFYTRPVLDEYNFSKPNSDQWRPSEVIADAVTPLSKNFCDGSIEDSFMTAGNGSLASVTKRYGCSGSDGKTSYRNQPRISETYGDVNDVSWMRTNAVDSLWAAATTGSNKPVEGESPIFIHPQGNPMTIGSGQYKKAYKTLNEGRDLIEAPDEGTQMNMIMVSGIVPSRAGQSYGGLHNFPRFLENWDKKKLFLSGAFLQLNFSTYATAPYDQENWQPGDGLPTTEKEWISYYVPPDRRWGYDVGLQYAPAGPVARRFRFSQPTRSEFYSEPAASDPYIKNLCRSIAPVPANCQ